MIAGAEKSDDEVDEILEHGLSILSEHDLKCFPFTLKMAKDRGCNTFGVKPYVIAINPNIKWEDWMLKFNGKEYRSLHSSQQDWHKHYTRS